MKISVDAVITRALKLGLDFGQIFELLYNTKPNEDNYMLIYRGIQDVTKELIDNSLKDYKELHKVSLYTPETG